MPVPVRVHSLSAKNLSLHELRLLDASNSEVVLLRASKSDEPTALVESPGVCVRLV